MNSVALVTGAGSGVGRAVALALASRGWSVALVGRREAPLQETIALAGTGRGTLRAFPCDIADEAAVQRMAQQVQGELGEVEALVNAAGTNAPRRLLTELSNDTYRQILDVNLNGAFYCVQAVLPGMRQRQRGTIVNIVSDAGLRASPKAGPAYVASKFGLAGLSQSINAEERQNGVRCCAIFPGDIDTPLLEKRPAPPATEARQKMLQPDDIAACVLLAIELPPRAIVEELVVRPR